MAKKKKKKSGCVSQKVGLKRNGRLKKGFRWARGRRKCILKAKGRK